MILYRMSSFDFYHWNQFRVIPLACALHSRKFPKFSATSIGCPLTAHHNANDLSGRGLMMSSGHANSSFMKQNVGHWTARDTDFMVQSSQLEIPKTQRSSTNKFSISISECRLRLIILWSGFRMSFQFLNAVLFPKMLFLSLKFAFWL